MLLFIICTLPWVADVQDEVDHLIDRDGSVMISIRQAENRRWHSAIAEDLVKGVGSDRIVLAYQISDRLQELDDIDPIFVRRTFGNPVRRRNTTTLYLGSFALWYKTNGKFRLVRTS